MHEVVSRALTCGIAEARPGITTGELDARVREIVAIEGYVYPHHSGHGIGTTYHEQPRIVPGGQRELRPGMVIAIEPGAYDGNSGCRLEAVVQITEDGATPMSAINFTIA